MCYINVFTPLRTFRATNILSRSKIASVPLNRNRLWLLKAARSAADCGRVVHEVILVRGLLRFTTTVLRSDRWLADVKVCVWCALTIAAAILTLVRRDVRVGSTAFGLGKAVSLALLICCRKVAGSLV